MSTPTSRSFTRKYKHVGFALFRSIQYHGSLSGNISPITPAPEPSDGDEGDNNDEASNSSGSDDDNDSNNDESGSDVFLLISLGSSDQ